MCLPKFGGKQFSNIIIKIYGTYFCRYLEESINFLLGTLKNLKDRTAGIITSFHCGSSKRNDTLLISDSQ
jgi:hypothetical protein